MKKNYKKVIGFGISLGGGTVFDYLVNKKESLDGAIMLGSGGFAAWEMSLLVWLVRILNIKAMRNPFVNEYDVSLFPKEYSEWKAKNFPKVPVKMLMKALYKQKREGLVQKLERIKCPIMLINGTAGLLTERSSVEQYFKTIPSDWKYGLVVEGASHTVHKSKQNTEILDHLVAFIRDVLDPNISVETTKRKGIVTLE